MALTVDQILTELAALKTTLMTNQANVLAEINALQQIVADVTALAPPPPPPPPPPPAPGESADGTSLTTTIGAIIDANLVAWTLVASAGAAGMQIARNGVVDTATALVAQLLYKNHAVYQSSQNASSISKPGWWQMIGTAWVDAISPLAPPPPAPSGGVFTVTAGGGFHDPSGHAWLMRGLNVYVHDSVDEAMAAINGHLLQQYPGITAMRLCCNATLHSADFIAPIVAAYSAHNIVLEVQDHWCTLGGNNAAWYAAVAAKFKDNPYVFLGTPNEPAQANVSQCQINIINTIRAAGFKGPVGIQWWGGYDSSTLGPTVAAVGTTNLFSAPHMYYANSDPAYPAQWVANDIAKGQSLGLFTVHDEFGNSSDGSTVDQQGNATLQAHIDACRAGKQGALFWAANNANHPNGADSAFLVPDGSTLTPTGVFLQPWLSGH